MQSNPPVNFLHSPQEEEQEVRRSKRRIFLILIILLTVMVAGCTARAIIGEYAPDNPEAYDPVTLKPKTPEGIVQKIKYFVFSKANTLEGADEDRINILILGMGGIGHEGPFLTDSIIIACLKPSARQVALISIPRDLGVEISGHGLNKINSANALGEAEKAGYGAVLAKKTIEDAFDMDIHYYARIDFKAFEEIIDEIGGVKINVENPFVDEMYPAPNNGYQTISFEKGVQIMNGERALQFVRSRHGSNGEGSDFARAKRQQKMLSAVKEKILSLGTLINPVHIYKISQSLNRHIVTDFEFADTIELVKLGRTLDATNITSLVLDDSPKGYLEAAYTPDGAFILKPKSGDFGEIRNLIKNIFTDDSQKSMSSPGQDIPPLPQSPQITIEIQNGTWEAGLAARIKKHLEDKGIAVETISNTAERPQAESGIYKTSGAESYEILAKLQKELNIPVKQTPPAGAQASTGTDILVVLGEDYNNF